MGRLGDICTMPPIGANLRVVRRKSVSEIKRCSAGRTNLRSRGSEQQSASTHRHHAVQGAALVCSACARHVFARCIRTANPNQASFSPSGQREISVHSEPPLGHLRYDLTDVPPPLSPSTDQSRERTALEPQLTVAQQVKWH